MSPATTLLAVREAPTAALRLIAAPTRTPRPTTHACLRYAQRVLSMTIEEEQLRADLPLRGRCARGIGRLLKRAVCARKDGNLEIWIVGTRAIIVRNAYVLTILVASKSRGFGKLLRQANDGHREAGVVLRSSSPACPPASRPLPGSP